MHNHKHSRKVAIFWDYENCPAPSGTSGCEVVKEIRRVAQAYGSIKVFKAYLELPEHSSSPRSLQLRSEFQASGVSLTDCPHNGRKDVADKMILVDMMAHAIDNPAPWTFVLISGDRDFAYAISVLRLRRYQVVLLSPPTAHISLKSQATTCLDWSNIVKRLTSPRLPGREQEPVPAFRPLVPATSIRATIHPQIPSKDRDSHLSDESDSYDEVDIIEYLKARQRHRRLSTSSDTSHSTVSESLYDTTTTYSSTQEEPVIFPPPLPAPEARYNTDPKPSVPTNHRQTEGAGQIPSGPVPVKLTFGSAEKRSPTVPAPPPIRGHIPPIHSLPATDAIDPIQPPAPALPFPKLPVPENFQPLVKLLREYRSDGFGRPSRFDIARVLDKHAYIYSQAKVDRFAQYIALAEGCKIVTQGGDWVALRPEWF